MVDAYVLGDGLPELAAALELAEVGLSVRVGVPEQPSPAWRRLPDRGTPDPDGALRDLLDHVSAPLAADASAAEHPAGPVAVPPSPVLLRDASGEWAPQPTPAVLGIPAVPLSSRALALLGRGGATRAYLDRVKPVLTIGDARALGGLVRARLGRAALERLVEPLVHERFGLPADEVEVAIAVPGLNGALTRAGSLSGAAFALVERDVARETRIAPPGGWPALREALLDRLALYGVEFGDGSAVTVRRSAGGASGGADRPGAASRGGRADVVAAGAADPGAADPDTAGSAGAASDLAAAGPGRGESGVADDGLAGEAAWIVAEGDLEIPVRALVFDVAAVHRRRSVPDGTEPGGLELGFGPDLGPGLGTDRAAPAPGAGARSGLPLGEIEALRPELRRLEAEARIGDPGLPAEAGDLPAVQLVTLGGEVWSVRFGRREDGFRACVRGPAVSEAEAEALLASGGAEGRVREVLALAGAVPQDEGEPVPVRSVVAPRASAARRGAEEERLEAFRVEHRELLPVGDELHGGDLAGAVADARTAAVPLRRRLAGISG
ncbi:MAG: hypothetical protein QM606_02070 [Leucobacter sp.]